MTTASSVVHVLWDGGIGGIERLVHQMARQQSSSGDKVAVAFAHPVGPFTEALAQDDVEVIDLELGTGFDVRPNVILSAGARLRRFDVLHVHTFNIPVALVSICSRRAIVYTEHGSYGAGRRLETAKYALKKRFLHRSTVVVAANSDFTTKCIATHYGLSGGRVGIVPNGVAFGPPPNQPARPRIGPLRIGFVGRWATKNRLERVLRGVAVARESTDVRLMMVGGGDQEDALRRLAAELNLLELVEFAGYRFDLDDVFDRIDVLVQPGLESFGMSIVEGCGRGVLPVVFADGGGATEVLPPDGRIVQSVAELGSVLAAISGSAALGAEARAQRAAWVRAKFDITQTVDGYRALYERAAASQS